MKIILSRKGFDAQNGGVPSPIFPDGTALSMPIPGNGTTQYGGLEWEGRTYSELLNELTARKKKRPRWAEMSCHLDPDIRPDVCCRPVEGWLPAFGQAGAAQTHLENRGVGEGDLFLFFGWFRRTQWDDGGRLRYVPGAPDIHLIYGYLQVGRILRGQELDACPWHPHSALPHFREESAGNALYLASDFLHTEEERTDLPGCGVLPFAEKRVLTAPGRSRGCWRLPDCFRGLEISYHSPASFREGYFRSAAIGQEFVVEEDPAVSRWALDLLK